MSPDSIRFSTVACERRGDAVRRLFRGAAGAWLAGWMLAGSALLCGGCSNGEGKAGSDTGSAAVEYTDSSSFHADNDIAMTVRSIADAITVGEPLDSDTYSFEGVMTDGAGTPLYLDYDGIPGEWEVTVIDDTTADISSKSSGEIAYGALKEYLLRSLGLSEDDWVATDTVPEVRHIRETYHFGEGHVHIERRPREQPDGECDTIVNVRLQLGEE